MPEAGTTLLDNVLTVDEYILMKINRVRDDRIASDLYVGKGTLDRWKKKAGIRRYHINQKRYEMIMEMKLKGMDTYEIARALRITPRNCWYIIEQFSKEEEQHAN